MSEQETPQFVATQLARIRHSGRVTSMFNMAEVQTEAHEMGFRHLWAWLENLKLPESMFGYDTEQYGRALEASTYYTIDEHDRPVPVESQDFTGL